MLYKSTIQGFSLIEVIIAVAMVSAGIVAVSQAFPLSIQLTKSGEQSIIATQMSQAQVEEMHSLPYNSIISGTTTEDYGSISHFENYKRVVNVVCLDTNLTEVACNYSPIINPEPLKRITVNVYWHSPRTSNEDTVSLYSFISNI